MSSVKVNKAKRGGRSARPTSSGAPGSGAARTPASAPSSTAAPTGRLGRRLSSPRFSQASPSGPKRTGRQSSNPAAPQASPPGRRPKPSTSAVGATQPKRKRSNGDVLLHYLNQDSPAKKAASPKPFAAPSTDRQVHYPSLPGFLRDELALRALLSPFGRITSMDMNYVGRGALVTFAKAESADAAIQGAMMSNGKLLKGTHPAALPQQRGRGLTDASHPLRPSLGRHNLDEEDVDALDKKPSRKASRNTDYDEQDEQDETSNLRASNSDNDEEEKFSDDFDDDDGGNMDEDADDKGDYDDEDDGANGDEDDFDEPPAPAPALKRTTKSPMLQNGYQTQPQPSSIAENARSTLRQWQPVRGAKKAATKEFGRFGSSLSAMDVDSEQEAPEEEAEEDEQPVQRNRFAGFDPTKNLPMSTTPSIFKAAAPAHSTTGPPTAIGRELAKKLAAHTYSAPINEDDEGEDVDHENGDGDSGLAQRFSSGGNDSDDFNSGDENGMESEARSHDYDDEEDAENDDAESHHSDGDMEVENGDEDDDEEDVASDRSPSPPPGLPLPSASSMVVDRKPGIARRAPTLPPKSASIIGLATVLNPLCNPGKLEAKFDPSKQHWHPQLEQEDDKRAVGSFQRPAGGDDIPPPERVRTVSWLYKSLIQAEKNATDAESSNAAPRLEIYNYLLNRFRQILKELTQQSTMCLLSCYIAETIARRTLRMRVEVLMETPHVDLSTFNTGREKVLDNAFEMCKNLYTFFNQHDMRSPFASELLSYYLMYRLQQDGVTPSWTTVLDSLATVYTRAGTRRSSKEYSSFLAGLRCDPHIDFVTKVAEIMSSYNWSALRTLTEKATFLQLCSLADLLPEFVYFAVDQYCTSTAKSTRPSLPASYLQYNFFLRHDLFTSRLPESYASEPIITPKGSSLSITDRDDGFYPLPSAVPSTPRSKKKATKGGETYLPTDQVLWREERDEIMKLLSSIAPTFMYSSSAELPIDLNTALQVYLRWADTNMFGLTEDSSDTAFEGADEDIPLKNPASYVIPSMPSHVSPLYEHILDSYFANGAPKSTKPATAAPPKVIPPPPKRTASTTPAVIPAPQAASPIIKVKPAQPSEPAPVTSTAPAAAAVKMPALSFKPTTAPGIKKPFVPPPKAADSSQITASLQLTSEPKTASAPQTVVAAVPPPAIPAAFEARMKELENTLAQFVQKEKQMEQYKASMEQKIREEADKLKKYQELYAARHASSAPTEASSSAMDVSSALLSLDPVYSLELPSVIGASLLFSQVASLHAKPIPIVLTFKMVASVGHLPAHEPGTVEHWLESKLSYPSSLPASDDSSCVKTLTASRQELDLRPDGPFNDNMRPFLEQVAQQPWAENPPMVASIVKVANPSWSSEVTQADVAALKGTKSILFFISISSADDSFWSSQRGRLASLLQIIPDSNNASLLVLYFDPRSPTEHFEVRRQLGLDNFPFAARISVSPLNALDGSNIDFSTTLGLLQASERLEQILCELASQTQPDVPHGTVALKQLLEPSSDSIVQRSYQSYRHAIEEAKSTLPLTTTSSVVSLNLPSLPSPSAFAYEWNQLLGSVWKSVVSEELLSVNWPAPETLALFPFLESHGWPTASWNTPSAFDQLTNFIMSFIIDDVAVQAAFTDAGGSDENWLDLESVSRYISALIGSHSRLDGFVPHASIVLQQFKERSEAAQLTARKTGHIPVLLPFSWHALFELVYSFLLEQMAHEMVCLDVSSIPMTAKVPEEDRQWKRARRDRQLSEANTWTSWYQGLCPTVEDVRKQEHARLKRENPEKKFSALLGQFSPTASPATRGLSFAVPESPRVDRSPFQANPTPYKAPPPSTQLSPPPFSLETSSPLLKASSTSTPRTASPAVHRAASPVPTVSADSLHDRLRSLQDRLSRMTDSAVSTNRAPNPKRRAEEASYALPPPQAKRKAD